MTAVPCLSPEARKRELRRFSFYHDLIFIGLCATTDRSDTPKRICHAHAMPSHHLSIILALAVTSNHYGYAICQQKRGQFLVRFWRIIRNAPYRVFLSVHGFNYLRYFTYATNLISQVRSGVMKLFFFEVRRHGPGLLLSWSYEMHFCLSFLPAPRLNGGKK